MCINLLKKPLGEFTNKECKIMSSVVLFLTIVISYILSLIMSFGGRRDMLILFIMGIIPNLIWSVFVFFLWDLNKYFDLIKDGKDTILAISLRFILFGIGLTSYMAWVFYVVSNSLILAISVGSGLLYQGIFMFFRRNSCWSETHTDDEGNIVYTYDIIKYWRNSLSYCFFISLGLIQISLALINNTSVIFPVIWTICSILVSLVLSPDITHEI